MSLPGAHAQWPPSCLPLSQSRTVLVNSGSPHRPLLHTSSHFPLLSIMVPRDGYLNKGVNKSVATYSGSTYRVWLPVQGLGWEEEGVGADTSQSWCVRLPCKLPAFEFQAAVRWLTLTIAAIPPSPSRHSKPPHSTFAGRALGTRRHHGRGFLADWVCPAVKHRFDPGQRCEAYQSPRSPPPPFGIVRMRDLGPTYAPCGY